MKLDDFSPTPENINALPEPLRLYIHELETRCDPAGDVAALTFARDQVRQLEASNRALRDREAKLREQLDEAEHKAIDALARYKFWTFAYNAAWWVKVNRLTGAKRPSPFAPFVKLARELRKES